MISILLVDDEPVILDVAKAFLERIGEFKVTCVESAEDALRHVKETQYDAIVSDYEMPVMNGIEFLRKIRGSGMTIPFIIFTGRGREDVVIEALNSGADYYIQKGGDPRAQFTELSYKVRQAVQKRLRTHVEPVREIPDGKIHLKDAFSLLQTLQSGEKLPGQEELFEKLLAKLKALERDFP